jgi:prephenate dehydrogenase
MKTVAIVGVGLIGGSFALALRKAGFKGRIIGVSSTKTIESALAGKVIDEGMRLERAVFEADLVYLAQPISRILRTLEEINLFLREGAGALVTDAGSTKAEITSVAARFVRRAQFLGGHPMAGKETRGVEESDPDLFAGRTYVLTPQGAEDMDTPAAQEFLEWIRRIGGVPVILNPEEHDQVVSWTSHLPQLASTALASALARRLGFEGLRRVAGPGLQDMTRLAQSSYDIWRDILATNGPQIERALDAYISELRDLRARLSDPEMSREFEIGADFAARLRRKEEEDA